MRLRTSSVTLNSVGVYAPSTNADPVVIGPSDLTLVTGHILEPGCGAAFDAIDPFEVWMIGTTADIVSWLGLLPR